MEELRKLKQEILEGKATQEDLESGLQETLERLDSSEILIIDLNQNLGELTKSHDDLSSNNELMKQQCEHLANELEIKTDELTVMKNEKLIWVTSEAGLIDEIYDLTSKCNNLKKENDQNSELYQQFKVENDRLNVQMVEFKSENNRLDDVINDSKKENERLKINSDDLRKANEHLLMDCNNLRISFEKALGEKNDTKRENDTLKRELDLQKRQNEKLNNNYNFEHAEKHCLNTDYDNQKWEYEKLLKKEEELDNNCQNYY